MKRGNKILRWFVETRLIASVLAIVLIVASCKTAQVLPPKPVILQTKESVTTRLKPVVLAPDRAYLKALFECDSSKQVVLRQIEEERSKNVKSDFTFNNGQLEYTAEAIHDTLYVTVTDSSLYREVPVPYAVPGPTTNILTWWQKTQIYASRVLLGFILAFGVYKALKFKSII